MKEQGLKPKKKYKHVEEHYDDCGDNLDGLPVIDDSDEEGGRDLADVDDEEHQQSDAFHLSHR